MIRPKELWPFRELVGVRVPAHERKKYQRKNQPTTGHTWGLVERPHQSNAQSPTSDPSNEAIFLPTNVKRSHIKPFSCLVSGVVFWIWGSNSVDLMIHPSFQKTSPLRTKQFIEMLYTHTGSALQSKQNNDVFLPLQLSSSHRALLRLVLLLKEQIWPSSRRHDRLQPWSKSKSSQQTNTIDELCGAEKPVSDLFDVRKLHRSAARFGQFLFGTWTATGLTFSCHGLRSGKANCRAAWAVNTNQVKNSQFCQKTCMLKSCVLGESLSVGAVDSLILPLSFRSKQNKHRSDCETI